jgi:tripartite-type tricarboxylate transporter receptor subunit TctC
MTIKKSFAWPRLGLALGTGLISMVASAQSPQAWPERAITWVVGYAPGGTTDVVARTIAKKVSEDLGHPIVVQNRPGANSNIGAVAVLRAGADGYTFYVGSGANAINRTLYANPGYDIAEDFSAVALFGTVANLLVVNPDLLVHSVKEYIDYAKKNPGKLTCGSSGTGSSIHMSCEMFKLETGTDIMHVPFNGSGPAMTALLGKQVDSIFENMPTVMPNVQAGKLRALGVTSPERWPTAPEIPTLNESGVPAFSVVTWFGLFAPAQTKGDIVKKMNEAVNAALRDKATRDVLFQRGLQVPAQPNPPGDFAQRVKSDVQKWATVVRESGAKAD